MGNSMFSFTCLLFSAPLSLFQQTQIQLLTASLFAQLVNYSFPFFWKKKKKTAWSLFFPLCTVLKLQFKIRQGRDDAFQATCM